MVLELDEKDLSAIREYRLPSFTEIPDVGLYLNQAATYINRYLEPFLGFGITESMISNYVKKKLIGNPVKKQYSREMIAYLLFIALCKNVSSLDDILLLINLQKENNHSVQKSYEYFKTEFEEILLDVFALRKKDTSNDESASTEEELLQKLVVAIAHKIYVDCAFRKLREGRNGEER